MAKKSEEAKEKKIEKETVEKEKPAEAKPEKTSKEKAEAKEKKTKKPSQLEFEKMVIELADNGLTSEKIGEELRKQGIHSKHYKKKISAILKEKGKYVNPDLKNVENKLERIKTHYAKNKQDKRAMREKDRIFAQVRKLKKYFKIPVK